MKCKGAECRLKPESSGVSEKRDQSAINVAGHDRLDSTQELSTNKDCRHHQLWLDSSGAGQTEEEGVDVGAWSIAVELHYGGADA